ncbi:MAG: sigma factor [Candidatus Kapaibacteriota bacterium]
MDIKKKEIVIHWANLFTNDLLKYAVYKVSDFEIAENLVQDTFEAAILNFEKFKRESSPKTWLFGILKNKIVDFYKQK